MRSRYEMIQLVFINVSFSEYLEIKLTKWNLEDLDCKIVFGLILWCQIFYIQIVQTAFAFIYSSIWNWLNILGARTYSH